MKNPSYRARLLLAVGAVCCLPAAAALGQDTNVAPAEATTNQLTPPAPQPAPPAMAAAPSVAAAPGVAAAPSAGETAAGRLPYGVADILKLTQAQVSEDVVLNYVLNSGTVYNLGPKDIINLRNQGVSDRVLTAMMTQRNRVPEESARQAAVAAASQPQGPVPGYPDANAVIGPPPYAQVYVEPPPAPEPPPSTVYVVPATPLFAPPYGGYYPYYGTYYAPGVSFVYTIGRGGFYRGYHRIGHYHAPGPFHR